MDKNAYYSRPYTPKTLETLPCAVCGAEDFRLFAPENNLSIVRCLSCEYVFVNPRPCLADLEEYYLEYYPDEEGVPEEWGGEMAGIFKAAHADISAKFNGGRILDIGSSYGHFLSQFDDQKWSCTGIDPSRNAIAYCREQYPHVTAHAANFEDVALDPATFEVVTSFYVLEHVFNPREFMGRIRDLLVPGGLAVIRIPYTRPFFPLARLLRRPLMYAPMHLNDFAPRHFERMCSDIGFSEVNSSIGALRESADMVDYLGAKVFGGAGKLWGALAPGDSLFPFAGAYTYELRR